MRTPEDLKRAVREKYGALAVGDGAAGCGPCDGVSNIGEDYSALPGYFPAADLGLGCGIPVEFARINEGETVIDLGSGAGNDAFVARTLVGERGRVIGVDMTEAMVEKAQANARRLGFENVEFIVGEIEDLPVDSGAADIVISNCVLNLVPDKARAFAEVFRVLRWGGRFSISDVVTAGKWEEAGKRAAEEYVGCVAGASDKDDYLATVRAAGFVNVAVAKERRINIPKDVLRETAGAASARAEAINSDAVILSVTVYGEKLKQYRER
ncbi:MAG TPA: arsenite methyltransferase [Pyrinomonadaceae bacterium]